MKKFVKNPSDGLQTLWQEGFFEKWQTSSAILKKLESWGNNFTSAQIGVALLRAKKILTRRKKSGLYEYVQKINHIKLDTRTIEKEFSHIHPLIKEKCTSLYLSKEYAEAVEKSFKIVRDKLRALTGYETGSEAFGKGKLYIKGASASNVDDDFNQAVKFLTMAIDMFRNEKSHTSDSKINDPIRAYQYLAMSSLALSLIENSEIKKS